MVNYLVINLAKHQIIYLGTKLKANLRHLVEMEDRLGVKVIYLTITVIKPLQQLIIRHQTIYLIIQAVMQVNKQVQQIIYKQTLVLKMKPLLFQVPILRYLVAQKHQILSLKPLKQTPNLLLSICLMDKNNQQKD